MFDLEAKEISNNIFIEILVKNILEMEIKKKLINIFFFSTQDYFFFQLEIIFFLWKIFWDLTFRKNIFRFEILRFWKIILRFEILKKYFQILKKIKISKFEISRKKSRFFIFSDFFKNFVLKKISKFSKFIITSKSCFVINFHSILIILVCMNSYQIRRIVSTCLNIRTTIIKEVIAY